MECSNISPCHICAELLSFPMGEVQSQAMTLQLNIAPTKRARMQERWHSLLHLRQLLHNRLVSVAGIASLRLA
jgi:hypothetical protein